MISKFNSGLLVKTFADFLKKRGKSEENLKILEEQLDKLLDEVADRVVARFVPKSNRLTYVLKERQKEREARDYVRREVGS